jgi:hypothetical protein
MGKEVNSEINCSLAWLWFMTLYFLYIPIDEKERYSLLMLIISLRDKQRLENGKTFSE